MSMYEQIVEVCEHDVLQTARGNLTILTPKVHVGTKMNYFNFEVKRSKVKVTTGPNMVKNHSFENLPFRQRHTGRRFSVEGCLVSYMALCVCKSVACYTEFAFIMLPVTSVVVELLLKK